MKVEENEDKIEEGVKERMKDLHNKGEYDLSQSPEEYEKIIQKLEAEVRNHISVQQQMKLYIESYQSKVEELEPLEGKTEKLNTKIEKLNKNLEKLTRNNNELNKDKSALKRKLDEKQKDFNKKIDSLNHKIKELQSKIGM